MTKLFSQAMQLAAIHDHRSVVEEGGLGQKYNRKMLCVCVCVCVWGGGGDTWSIGPFLTGQWRKKALDNLQSTAHNSLAYNRTFANSEN